MIAKITVNIFFIIVLGTLQIAFISGLPGWLSYLNLYLVVIIFILGFAGFGSAIWWSVGAGFMLEVFSFLPFGVYLLSLGLTIIIANFLLNYFFTNRSLYSFFAIVSLSTLASQVIINLMIFLFAETSNFFFSRRAFWILTLEQAAINLIFTLFVYYLVYFLSKNLRPVFLIKKDKY